MLAKYLDAELGLENARVRRTLAATAEAGPGQLALLIRVEPSPVTFPLRVPCVFRACERVVSLASDTSNAGVAFLELPLHPGASPTPTKTHEPMSTYSTCGC